MPNIRCNWAKILWPLPLWGRGGRQKFFNIFPNSGNSRRISFFVKFPVFVQDFHRFWHEQLRCIQSLLKGRLTMMLGCELLFSFLLRHSFSCKGISKLATRGFQNVRLGLKKGPSLGYWILWTTFAKKPLHSAFSMEGLSLHSAFSMEGLSLHGAF